MLLSELNEIMYKKFQGLPFNAPIVRNNQLNDAFVVTVLKILYGLDLDLEFDSSQAEELAKYVVAPPDSGIDIFIEHIDEDEEGFDVIQVKNVPMNRNEIKAAFAKMKQTIDEFCDDASSINSNSCREILSSSNLNKSNKKRCHYYVVHTGKSEFSGLANNETVINEKYLHDIYYNGNKMVKASSFTIEKNNRLYHDLDNKEHNAICITLNCYDLAVLNNKFDKAKIGRNLLFGQNFRDGLGPTTNKSYEKMKYTIINTPEMFWYYNNGITIVADEYSLDLGSGDIEKIDIKNFSIVNGAQTTSTLGHLLKEFQQNKDNCKIESLKKASVLARVEYLNDLSIKENVAIYNNSQNNILNRDLVANSLEQVTLQKKLLSNNHATIYIEIRRGARKPSIVNKKYKHRITKNETLAQIASAAFEIEPFTAKDKKSALFCCNYAKPEFRINEYYHRLFYYDKDNSQANGILFKKSIPEIDEALFSLHLYNEGSKTKRKELRNNIVNYKKILINSDNTNRIQENINEDSNVLETIGGCKFYCITTYYLFKERFDIFTDKKEFDYDKFYTNKYYKDNLLNDYIDLFLMNTIRILNQNAHDNNKSGNIANWVRGKACQDTFITSLRAELTLNGYLKKSYLEFVSKYKI